MDLVECEAPLDNSFQKDRLELVNKGSLGRRRKPSRSNLRLILSPSNERQIIDVFHNHQQFDSESSFVQEKVSPIKILRESSLDNHHSKSLIVSELEKKFSDSNKYSDRRTLEDNYRDVVGSIKQIYSNNCFDLNGNSERTVSSINNHQNSSSAKLGERNKNYQQSFKSESKNKLNSKYHRQFSVTGNHQNGITCDQEDVTKLNNGLHYSKFNQYGNVSESQKTSEYNHYPKLSNGHISDKYNFCEKYGDFKNQKVSEVKNHCIVINNGHLPNKSDSYKCVSKNQKNSEYKNHQGVINSNKVQQTSKTHQNVITFSNHRQIVTPAPIQVTKLPLANGNAHAPSSQDQSSKSHIETSLPRTSKEPSLVEEARQFSIEAKLKRKNSDVQGRSAVLIRTWERRTQSESHSKTKKDSKTVVKNRFCDKDNCDTQSSAMPDSYICTKYKGSLQNGDNQLKGELVSYVRDVKPEDAMLYRVPENSHRRIHQTSHTNGEVTISGNSTFQEPEWISLSRKLCAKFVEGHIETNSADSYPYEEPEGVGEDLSSSPESKKNHSSSNSTIVKTETNKKKISPSITPSEEAAVSDEPPWIHLSRKLCNKFIEEHIEYPPITNGHFIEVPELVEPNGDVRIIEKVGKPKGHKSKQKKETEPEWVSLSKKLRAKFIESHIDDPDTIALDNQLNASDPEETGSETLSDISQDTAIPKEINIRSTLVECKNHTLKNQEAENYPEIQQNGEEIEDLNYGENRESAILSEKECCWEYEEMEFDQESNSGNFQDLEYVDQPVEERNIHRISLSNDHSDTSDERITFTNSFFSRNSEFFNNDVNFLPYPDKNEVSTNPEQNKLITVQFIAHTRKEQSDDFKNKVDLKEDQSPKNESFFNFSSWEVAHYQDDDSKKSDEIPPIINSDDHIRHKDFLSKSLDNLCDSLEESCLIREKKRASICSVDNFDLEKKKLSVSNKLTSKETNEIFKNDLKVNYSPRDISFGNKNSSCNCTCENRISKSEENIVCPSNLFLQKEKEIESSSEDEVFECIPRKKHQFSSSSESSRSRILSSPKSPTKEKDSNKIKRTNSPENLNEEMSFKQSEKTSFSGNVKKETHSNQSTELSFSENLMKEIQCYQEQDNKEKPKNNQTSKMNKNSKCNGMIPNSIYDSFPECEASSSKQNESKNNVTNNAKGPAKMGMSKWITLTKSEQNISKPEYSNVQSFVHKEQKSPTKSPQSDTESKDERKKNKVSNTKINEKEEVVISKVKSSPRSDISKSENYHYNNIHGMDENTEKLNILTKNSELKEKCKSLCDISRISNSSSCGETKFRQHESIADLCSSSEKQNRACEIQFQHFESDSEIPLCAKLVSNHNKKMSRSIPSVTPSNRTESPCPSDSSHVYEDMFKETPSGPSDSETSWTVLKHNTYYVNGRSSSMNDLDFSDSCSMSVKCDYASSSESSTLQSRHSSYASSSFYVNLRDYDSHMLEPNLNKSKKSNTKTESSGKPSIPSKSSPPTPESLRHLFTSPLTSIHIPPHHNSRMLNRMPSDPQSHYYSTAAATSSAFKHGFAPVAAKPKKTERSSSMKIKDIAHGIILTFKKLQNHSKTSSVPSNQHVDVSHLAELKSNSELGKAKKGQKDSKSKKNDKSYWKENGRHEHDSGFLSDAQRAKARRSSSDLTDWKSNSELFHSDKKKNKKKGSNKDKGKKNKSKDFEPRTVPTVSRKVQQMADGTLYLVTTVSGDSTMPGVYSDSPDTSSEISSHRSVKNSGESNC